MEYKNNQDDLLQQLRTIYAEKELLEKNVVVLHDCLSVKKLKHKISVLEKKKEMIISLKDMISKLHSETEPLNYLKSILERELSVENETNKTDLQPFIDLNPSMPKIDFNVNQSTHCKPKSLQSQSTQNIPEQTKTDSTLLLEDNEITSKTPLILAADSCFDIVDEYTQLMEQYDFIDIEETFKETNNIKSCSQTISSLKSNSPKASKLEHNINNSETINKNVSTEQTAPIQRGESPNARCTKTIINSFYDMNLKDGILFEMIKVNPHTSDDDDDNGDATTSKKDEQFLARAIQELIESNIQIKQTLNKLESNQNGDATTSKKDEQFLARAIQELIESNTQIKETLNKHEKNQKKSLSLMRRLLDEVEPIGRIARNY